MIPQTGETSFDVCLHEVGIAAGTEYGIEELMNYLNTWGSMILPYNSEDSMNEFKGFMGVLGNTHYEDYRYITSANVWHFLEVEDAAVRFVPGTEEFPSTWELGIQTVNRGVQKVSELIPVLAKGVMLIELWARPDPFGFALMTTSESISLSRSFVLSESPPLIADSDVSYIYDLGYNFAYQPGYTLKWKWAEALPWNEVLI